MAKSTISHFKIHCSNCKTDVLVPVYIFFRTRRIECPKCGWLLAREEKVLEE